MESFAPQGFRPKNPLITDPVNASRAEIQWAAQVRPHRHWNPYSTAASRPATAGPWGRPAGTIPSSSFFTAVPDPRRALNAVDHPRLPDRGVPIPVPGARPGPGFWGRSSAGSPSCSTGTRWSGWSSRAWPRRPPSCRCCCCMERYRRRPVRAARRAGARDVALSGQIQYLIYIALLLLCYAAFPARPSWRERRRPPRAARRRAGLLRHLRARGAARRRGAAPDARPDPAQQPHRPHLSRSRPSSRPSGGSPGATSSRCSSRTFSAARPRLQPGAPPADPGVHELQRALPLPRRADPLRAAGAAAAVGSGPTPRSTSG